MERVLVSVLVAVGGLGTSPEQYELAEAVRGFGAHHRLAAQARELAEADKDQAPQDWGNDCWSALAAQELLAMPFDGSVLDVCVTVDAFGHALAPGPVVPTLLAALLVARYGDDGLRARVDAGVRDGSFSAAVSIEGVVVGGAAVGSVLLPVGGRWTLVDAARLSMSSYAGIDPSRRVATVTDPAALSGDVLTGVTDDVVRET